jgi:4-hydroxyphenylpyruvate dioxygenase
MTEERAMTPSTDREQISDTQNPLGIDGIEFIEYSTSTPQVLEMMGFRPVARHRSREVLLYRQGDMNVIVNAHAGTLPRSVQPVERPTIVAIALRVRDAAAAYRYTVERGAWVVPNHVEVMELNIPAIHGVGSSRIYFVDRYRGIVQDIGAERMAAWTEFYTELMGFRALPDDKRYGILPKGRILQSPCGSFFLQLIEPKPGILDVEPDESLQRVGLGVRDVMNTVAKLRQRGVGFVESEGVHPNERGALTQSYLGGVMFELVHDERG